MIDMRREIILICLILASLIIPLYIKELLPPPKSSVAINTTSPTTTEYQTTKGVTYELKILNTRSYDDDMGYLHVVGEILNNGGRKTRYVEVTAIFYDFTNNIVTFESTNTREDVIFPGGTSPFEFILKDESIISQVKRISFQAKGR